MNIRLHNKYEVICGDKTYVAYNTMLKPVFNKLKNLEPYNSYFAIGTGTTDVAFTDTTLETYTASYANITEYLQPNILDGEMCVIKSKTFQKDEAEGLTFSEVGLTDTADANPTIYNRVVFKDQNDQPVTITKVAGERLQIKLTIYLEISNTSKFKLTAGDNVLVKQLLGENAVTNKNFVVVTGDDTRGNTPVYRDAPTSATPVPYDKLQYNLYSYAGFRTELTCNFGQGSIIEILLMLDDKPVLRYNCQGENLPFSSTKYVEGKIVMTVSGFNAL